MAKYPQDVIKKRVLMTTYYPMKKPGIILILAFIAATLWAEEIVPGSNIYSANGNIGVGISLPLSKADINGAVLLRSGSWGNPTGGSSLHVRHDSIYGANLRSRDWDAGTWQPMLFEASQYSFLNGNIGVGTLTPKAAVNIATHSGNRGLLLSLTDNPGGSNSPFLLFDARNGGANYLYAMRQQGDHFALLRYTGFWTGGYYVMSVGSNGNVGIGTANPAYKLDVDGAIRGEEVIVEILGADYVFEENYDLPDLTEVKTYITANKHLPDIPSAKEMQENGMGLLELNGLLLQKIEELTLYVIDLKEENDALKTRIEQIEAQMD